MCKEWDILYHPQKLLICQWRKHAIAGIPWQCAVIWCKPGFLIPGTIDILGWISLCCGWLSCALYNIQQHPGLYCMIRTSPLQLPVLTIKCVYRYCQMSFGVQSHYGWEPLAKQRAVAVWELAESMPLAKVWVGAMLASWKVKYFTFRGWWLVFAQWRLKENHLYGGNSMHKDTAKAQRAPNAQGMLSSLLQCRILSGNREGWEDEMK